MQYWAVENPHWMRQRQTQNYWSLNVWGGLIDNKVIGAESSRQSQVLGVQ
jgi:hypothetical protein